MLRPDRGIERVYLHRAAIDMRKQMDGLAVLVREVLRHDPLSGALFVFINRRRDKLKILRWERNGLVIWYKRLEEHRFHWPQRADEDVITFTGADSGPCRPLIAEHAGPAFRAMPGHHSGACRHRV